MIIFKKGFFMINRKELKASAKQQLKGNVLTFFALTLVMGLILGATSISLVAPLIISGPILLGITMFLLEVARKGDGEFETGFNGFKNFGPALVAYLLTTIFIALWSLLLVIPGIVATFSYSMTFYILADNPGMSGSEAIKKSKQMMKGHKWELFVLLLSFFWWYVLCGITFGIAYIYVVPYINVTMTNFYEKIKLETSNN